MKNITKIFTLLALTGMAFASCIEETFPQTSTATAEQIGASSSALGASVSGIPAQMCQGYLVYGEQTHETDMAYPQFMIAGTEMLGDFFPLGSNSGYDWYRNYNTFSSSYGKNSYMSYLPWRTLYMFVKSANDVISAVNLEDETLSDEIKGLAGIAYACRAHAYYWLTALYEPAVSYYTDCAAQLNTTVPIVSDKTPSEDMKQNPRASHDAMVEFILNDLATAEKCLANYTPASKYFPSLAVVYGLYARTYMWNAGMANKGAGKAESYAKAAEYARKAIDASKCTPLTEAQWLDLENGFNNINSNSSWMWGLKYSAENMGNLCNFTGWMSGEGDWGYSSLTFPSIDKSLYDKIQYSDFRKYTFLDPDRSVYPYQTCRDQAFLDAAPNYLSLKFRCLGGDWEDYSQGGAVDVPVMRVEEMYLIEAEAIGMSKGVEAGVAALKSFVNTYRDPNYQIKAGTIQDFQYAVLDQERIEFWGEGVQFPNAKRILSNISSQVPGKYGIMQWYAGTNAPADIFKFNCEGIKPNWNLVVPDSEISSNTAIKDADNNPDPTAVVKKADCAEGQFAPRKF